MKRTDALRHLDNKFQPGNAATGERGTQIDASWLNAVQEEIVNVILDAGIALDGAKQTQLRDAIGVKIGDATGIVFDSVAAANAQIVADRAEDAAAWPVGTRLGVRTYDAALPDRPLDLEVSDGGGFTDYPNLRPLSLIATPRGIGKVTNASAGVNPSLIVGALAKWDEDGATRVRPAWAADDEVPPSAATHSLPLTGHWVHPEASSAIIFGGGTAYHCRIGQQGTLSINAGGDNDNQGLANITIGYHIDSIEDDLGRCSHILNIGSSFGKAAGDYVLRVAGHVVEAYAQFGGVIGGNKVRVGDKADSQASVGSVSVAGSTKVILGKYNFSASGLEAQVDEGVRFSLHGSGRNIHLGNGAAQVDAIGQAGGENIEHKANWTGNVGGLDIAITGQGSVGLGGDGIALSGKQSAGMGVGVDSPLNASLLIGAGEIDGPGTAQIAIGGASASGTGLQTPDMGRQAGQEVILVPLDSDVAVEAIIIGTRSDGGTRERWHYKIEGMITNEGGTLSIVHQTTTALFETDADFNAAFLIAGGGTRLAFSCGKSGDTREINWVAHPTLVQVSHAAPA